MSVYAIIPFNNSTTLSDKIKSLKVKIYEGYAPAAWFVDYSGTTVELSKELKFGDDKTSAIVIPVSNYHGYASRDLWEWLDNNS